MFAPRILIVLAEQWPRALLRAELRERGYDAQGAPSLEQALVYPAEEAGRGRVRLIIVDRGAVQGGARELLDRLRSAHADPQFLLLDEASGEAPAGPWAAIVRRPFRVADVLQTVQRMLPLHSAGSRPGRGAP